MESVIRSISPRVDGLSLRVLNRDDRLELVNRTGRRVTIFGYRGEPYARLLPDGRAQVNRNSPAYYLNRERFASVSVPDGLGPRTPPAWRAAGGAHRFEWHDHRMHFMGTGTPPGVRDRSKRQVFQTYRIPIQVGTRTVTVNGHVVWTPLPGGGPPLAAILVFIGVVALGATAVVVVRRLRDSIEPRSETW